MIASLIQRKIKFEPRIKLNNNIHKAERPDSADQNYKHWLQKIKRKKSADLPTPSFSIAIA